jgi:integrase
MPLRRDAEKAVADFRANINVEVSRRPVPLHSSVVECLDEWRKKSRYNGDDDFLFPATRKDGNSRSHRTWCSRKSSVLLSSGRRSPAR